MNAKHVKLIKLLIMLAIVVAFVWFIFLYPLITFKGYENQVREAAEKYYEMNTSKLPTGNRVSTVTLQTLFTDAFLKDDLFVPYTKKACSPVNSWVKVVKKDNDYKYYVYLECGALKSSIDHNGPKIILKGKEEMTVEVSDKFDDPGIDRVVDKQDGYLDKENVKVTSNVDSTTPGNYEIKYTAVDKLGNKTVVTRKVNVVNTLSSQVKKILKNESRFTGNPENNNIRISNMDFKIVGIDSNKNIIVVTNYPVSYINYSKIDTWLNDYYYNLLSKKTKNMIVETSYCKSVADVSSKDCSSKTDNKKIYYPSVADINLAAGGEENFMKTNQLSWINYKDNEATAVGIFNEGFEGELYKKMDNNDIATIRPMFTIKGSQKIISGDGSEKSPFKLKDNKKADGNSKISDLSVGDIIANRGVNYRVIGKESDGTVKVISYENIGKVDELVQFSYSSKSSFIYNPKDKDNLGFKVNNQMAKYIDKGVFITHNISVPIYKNKIIYGEEVDTKKYKVLYSVPNIFEIFSAHSYFDDESLGGSNWYINSSKSNEVCLSTDSFGYVYDKPFNEMTCSVRVVAFINKDQFITGGNGTIDNPYTLR